jgi:hypothetical protein
VIAVVTGPPGAGKTYYTVRTIAQAVLEGRYVATNVRLAEDWPERIIGGHIARFSPRRRRRLLEAWRRRVIYVESVGELARVRLGTKGWEKNLEGRGVVVFDEAGEALDSRAWNEDKERRKADNRFFRQHRKLGWDVYLVAQEADQIDNRTRGLAEYEVQLRNLRRWKLWGLFPLAPCNVFLALWRWHGASGTLMKREWFLLSKRTAGLYDTHQMVQDVGDDDGLIWLPLEPPAELAQDDLSGAADGVGAPPALNGDSPVPPPEAAVAAFGPKAPVLTGPWPTPPAVGALEGSHAVPEGHPAQASPPPIHPLLSAAGFASVSDTDTKLPQ